MGILLKESNIIPDVLDVTEYIDDVEKFKHSGNVILNKVIDCLISDNAIKPCHFKQIRNN